MQPATILPSENDAWGFHGAMRPHAAEAWPLAFAAIAAATGAEAEAVRAFLDSRHGRHFADDVANHLHAGAPLAEAIASATATWMRWRIGRRMSREAGIPAGLAMLAGLVIAEGIAAEAALA